MPNFAIHWLAMPCCSTVRLRLDSPRPTAARRSSSSCSFRACACMRSAAREAASCSCAADASARVNWASRNPTRFRSSSTSSAPPPGSIGTFEGDDGVEPGEDAEREARAKGSGEGDAAAAAAASRASSSLAKATAEAAATSASEVLLWKACACATASEALRRSTNSSRSAWLAAERASSRPACRLESCARACSSCEGSSRTCSRSCDNADSLKVISLCILCTSVRSLCTSSSCWDDSRLASPRLSSAVVARLSISSNAAFAFAAVA
mmetsp:Transcript_106618/g.344165  ORF Transcript_106618/g.344165 Transcript_106618/m.344165 type:complete len:267 (+) Transcript_106618:182-982(+)